MDPRDWLKEARCAAEQGRHADALREHVRFHEHALEHRPALAGVRLSFALADWVELGTLYPEALRALQQTREAAAAALLAGPRRREHFCEVAAIDEALAVGRRTYELFRRLCGLDAEFARSCAGIALPALVEAKDFVLAAQWMGDPAARVAAAGELLDEGVRSLRRAEPAPRHLETKLVADAQVFAEEVGLILEVLVGVGRADEARSIRDAAIDRVDDEVVRAAVREHLARYA